MLLAFLAALLALRMGMLSFSSMSLFMDEAQYWDWSRELAWGFHDKPPMIVALVRLSTTLFGSGELGVKALAMLLYPITALCLVGFARALWPTSSGVRTGIVAAALYMTLPGLAVLGLLATTDAPLLLCWALACWALWRAQVTDRLKYWAWLGVAVGLGLLSKYTMMAFVPTFIWALWGIHGPKKGILRLGPWATVAIALAVVSPHLAWNVQHHFPTLHYTAQVTAAQDAAGGPQGALGFLAGQILMLGPLTILAGLWLWWRPVPAITPGAAGPTRPSSVSASQWANSTQLSSRLEGASAPPSTLLTQPGGVGQRKPVARGSAYYLAAVSSYRFLWACSVPLLLIALVQAFRAGSLIHWAAPAMVGLSLLVASRLSQPMVPLAAPRPNIWLMIVLAGNIAGSVGTVYVRELVGPNLPAQADVLARTRGWEAVFHQITPAVNEPVVRGLPFLTDDPELMAQSIYHLRGMRLQHLYWNPTGAQTHHYATQQSLPNRVGADVLLLTHPGQEAAIAARFAWVRPLQDVVVRTEDGAERQFKLMLLRGFLGYDDATYRQQSGTAAPSMETPVND